jgi:hypothetical protein
MTAIDILGQFQSLCVSYSRCIDLDREQMLKQVLDEIDGEVKRSMYAYDRRPHWGYDMNRLYALRELRDAILKEMRVEA